MSEPSEFERTPRGWPPLDGAACVFYGALLVPVLMLALAGGLSTLANTVQVGASPWPLGVPLWLALLAAVGVVEALRVASYRSTVYVISPGRACVRRGILSVRTRLELPLAGDLRVTLVDGDPCLHTASSSLVLTGLGPSEVDAVRLAVGLPAEHAPPAPARRRRGGVAVLAGLALLAAAQALGALGNRDRARFKAFEVAVGDAVSTAQAAVLRSRTSVRPVGSRSSLLGIFTDQVASFEVDLADTSRREPGQPTQPLTITAVRVECRMPWGALVYGEPRVVVSVGRPAEANTELLRELRAAFAAAGVEATWSPER